ncbi:gtp-binding protein [Phaffia rhodozyma]|uniref:Gtp-binding protein n=1 Tax=Phaffia rhodozyma TaxID=264483 RepID=A0A0F7SH98_PHARH|nr:gtp-binding protein [Phaffia rhodozyma]
MPCGYTRPPLFAFPSFYFPSFFCVQPSKLTAVAHPSRLQMASSLSLLRSARSSVPRLTAASARPATSRTIFPARALSSSSKSGLRSTTLSVVPRSFGLHSKRSFSRSTPAQASIAPSTPLVNEDGFIDLSHIRTLAVIAHVDHGKTTLVDQLLRQSGTIKKLSNDTLAAGGPDNGYAMDSGFVTRAMDSNDLEKERGITILSKCTSVNYNGHLINIVDTPGHADFGGEVERVLSMVDGVLLVVDATEGPSTQTRFVLGKALKAGLKPIVVMNKADRSTARPEQVDSDILDLFGALGASDDQMEYPIIYASAKQGWASLSPPAKPTAEQEMTNVAPAEDMVALFDLILAEVPAPVRLDRSKPFRMLTTQIDSDPYVGALYLGRIESGSISIGQKLVALDPEGKKVGEGKCTKIFGRTGLEKVPVERAGAGEIISVAGVLGGGVNVTICAEDDPDMAPLPSTPLDPPTISMFISANDSPFAGKEGTKLTSAVIKDRLLKEAETNVALKVIDNPQSESLEIRGRGVLHLGILLETLRREGFEIAVSPPRPVLKRDPETKKVLEPIEEVTINVDSNYIGTVIEKMTKRKAEILQYDEEDGKVRVVMEVPARGLLGYVSGEFNNDVHGQGTLNHIFKAYEPFKGEINTSRKGCLISSVTGEATAYAIQPLQARGVMFVSPGQALYTGMVIGESNKAENIEINVTKTKALTNFRAAGKDDGIFVAPARTMTLEECISYCDEDELIEITPKSVRLRKKILDSNLRKRSSSTSQLTFIDA